MIFVRCCLLNWQFTNFQFVHTNSYHILLIGCYRRLQFVNCISLTLQVVPIVPLPYRQYLLYIVASTDCLGHYVSEFLSWAVLMLTCFGADNTSTYTKQCGNILTNNLCSLGWKYIQLKQAVDIFRTPVGFKFQEDHGRGCLESLL